MRKIVSILSAIAFFVFVTSPGFGTVYRSGAYGCGDFEAEEKAYMEQLNDPDPYVSVTLVYALCLLLKGEVTNNQDDVSKGMLILHGLADQHSNIVANYWIAEYHSSGGSFNTNIADRNLDLAVDYYSRTLAIIKTYNSYPPLIYSMWEKNHNIEMKTYHFLPLVYLAMFYRGVYGDYSVRLLNSPSYEGGRDLETYPEYRHNIMGYINLAIEHAGNCKNLPLKSHFDKFSPYYIKVCAMYEEKAKLLKEAYVKRQLILNQDRCKDIGSDETVFAYCPEIDEAELKILDTYDSIFKESKKILHPIRDSLISAFN